MIDVRFHPLPTWPYQSTPPDKRRSGRSFRASWTATVQLLDRELRFLNAKDTVIECGLSAADIRVDGWPRASARAPSHPGVALHFEAPDIGHLRYATDAYEHYKSNLRAIALGLEALRAVDRYGITRGREQYRGFAELPSGIAMPQGQMTVEDAARFLVKWSEFGDSAWRSCMEHTSTLDAAYRMAAKNLHPDAGGDPVMFQKLQEAKALLDAHHTSRRA